MAEPHILSGWLSINRDSYTLIDDKISWNENPIELLADTYHFLNMDFVHGAPAANMIWHHDNEILQQALDFYNELNNRLDAEDWIELQSLLAESQAPAGIDVPLWSSIRAAHVGFQAGLDMLAVLPSIAEKTRLFRPGSKQRPYD